MKTPGQDPRARRDAEAYHYHVRRSPKDGCFIATVTEWPSLAADAPTCVGALEELLGVVADCLVDMDNERRLPPVPLEDP